MTESSQHTTNTAIFDGWLPPPTFAAIETTMFCNLKCHFCIQFQDGTTVRGPHMDEATFERVSDVLFPHLDEFQPSVSGEPLMSKGLDRVLDRAEKHGIRAEYDCNGTLLNERMLHLILPTLGRLHISFDGATRETFEALRAGARWDTVLENVKRAVAVASKLPDERRPPIGFACTLMQQNIRELPDLVDLSADLGLDFLKAAHMVPGIEEVQNESLYHDLELARDCIEQAAERARVRGLPFSVQPLDQLISDLAQSEELDSPHFRHGADQDGVALPGVIVNMDRLRDWPSAPPAGADRQLLAAKQEARQPASTVQPDKLPDSIWTCHFLWNRIYVGHDGNTMPCCVPGVPGLGNLKTDSLEDIWNGPVERAMRTGLVRKEPAPCCRGCQHIREVTDPEEIRQLMQGKALPGPEPLPPSLRPVSAAGDLSSTAVPASEEPARLGWESIDGAEGYEVEMSLDDFRTLLFATPWHRIELSTPEFVLPDWAWALAPAQPIQWRAMARLPQERRVIAAGTFEKLAVETD